MLSPVRYTHLVHGACAKFCLHSSVSWNSAQWQPYFTAGYKWTAVCDFTAGYKWTAVRDFHCFKSILTKFGIIHLHTVPLTGLEFREHRRGLRPECSTGRKWDSIDACNVKPCDILNVKNALVEPLYCVTEYYHKWDSVQSGAGWGWRNSWSSTYNAA